ncbi:MAG: HD domain-containing phosphohydrolase [Pseudomonadota bacterium]|jgi:HD-GYP domain-containing protein (c-di-GMP phosphodiesterase class II)
MPLFEHHDTLIDIGSNLTLGEKIKLLHAEINQRVPAISRVAAALYDPKTDLVKTFLHSSHENDPLVHYEAKLNETPSLREIVERRRPRIVNDLSLFDQGHRKHTQHIRSQGFASSYTMPMYVRGNLFGFLFFNSEVRATFTTSVLHQLAPLGHLIALTIINDLAGTQALLSTVKAARDMAHLRDDETGSHQDRMSRYARLIARKIAAKHQLSDEYIENIFAFSVLHDIGKMGVPDNILFKPGRLDNAELEIMRQHTVKGRQLIDKLLEDFELSGMHRIDMLRNIAELHHETLNGSGYPHGLKGTDIPIEARITAVADIFDALTSHRPYKQAWSNREALDMLESLKHDKLDPDCVDALIASLKEIEEIQRQFSENSYE